MIGFDEVHDQAVEVLARFDSEQVHKLMTVMGWGWGVAPARVPTATEISRTGQELLALVVNDFLKTGEGGSASTGGLRAAITVYPSHTNVSLSFVAVESSKNDYH